MSDKPATFSLQECLELRDLVRKSGLLYGLTHTYTGYPLVKEAREWVAAGKLGAVRKIVVEYPQGWLAERLEDTGQKQASWRLDPARAGVSSCMGDIGVHAANLAEYVSGLQITHLCADLHSFVPGRTLDDDGSILLRFERGARGVLLASQISVGEENALRIRLYGEKGGLEWAQQEPNTLWLKWNDRPTQMLRAAGGYLGAAAQANTRTPGGHPEGYLEAFANLYRTFADQIRIHQSGGKPDALTADLPGIEAAVRGMAFIEHAVAAGRSDTKWHELPRY
jgi:predicted dehydrogenase